MSPLISPLAAVDPRAELAADVAIGPFCVVGPHVVIGAGTQLANNVTLQGHVRLGRDNQIHANAVIGGEPQDLSYRGSETRVEIGDGNIIREGVTINRASEKEDGVTSIGNHCYLMACSHVAHDCRLGRSGDPGQRGPAGRSRARAGLRRTLGRCRRASLHQHRQLCVRGGPEPRLARRASVHA